MGPMEWMKLLESRYPDIKWGNLRAGVGPVCHQKYTSRVIGICIYISLISNDEVIGKRVIRLRENDEDTVYEVISQSWDLVKGNF